MIVVRNGDLPAALVVARPADGGVLVVVGPGLSRPQVRELSAMLLREPERRQLSRALARQ